MILHELQQGRLAMTHARTLHAFLATASGPICDDWLASHTVTPLEAGG